MPKIRIICCLKQQKTLVYLHYNFYYVCYLLTSTQQIGLSCVINMNFPLKMYFIVEPYSNAKVDMIIV